MKSHLSRIATLSLLGIGMLAASSGGFAQTPGFYAGGAIGKSMVSGGCGVVAAGVACDDTSTAWKVLAGYQIGKHFAAEAGYSRLADRASGGAGGAANTKSTAFEAVGIGGNPLTASVSIYGKLGMYTASTKTTAAAGNADESNSNLTFGFGARYDFSKPLAARAEWQRYKSVGGDTMGRTDITVLSIGAIVKF